MTCTENEPPPPRQPLSLRRQTCTACLQPVVYASGTIELPNGQRLTCACEQHEGGVVEIGISSRSGRSCGVRLALNGRMAHACVLAAPSRWHPARLLGAPGSGREVLRDLVVIARAVLDALAVDVDVVELEPESSDVFARPGCTSQPARNASPGSPVPVARVAETMRSAVGGVLLDRFTLSGLLGEGATAAVLAAYDCQTGRPVAAKLYREADPWRARDRELLSARVAHPNVCRIVEAGEQAGIPFIVLERLEGESLAQRFSTKGPLPLARARDVFVQLLSALEAVHQAGIVHRDVKPSNILLVYHSSGSPVVKLFDFGSALDLDAGATAVDDQRLVGTPAYMAPEQARCERLDVRADLYSVGVVLFEAVTGKRRIVPARYSDLTDHARCPLPDLRTVRPEASDALAALIGRATAPDRNDRFATASEMRMALAGIRVDRESSDVPSA